MRTLALTVAYDGTGWAGMQRQRVAPSVQGALEAALSAVLQHEVRVVAAGRTDAGVHALGQVISLRTANLMPVERVPRAVNLRLPECIRVRSALEKPDGFHARFSARWRRYWYLVQPTAHPDPLRGRFCWQVPPPLSVEAMQAALVPLVGCHDFAAFCHGGETDETTRTLHHARVRTRGTGIVVDLQAEAFVQRMMRLVVSNLVLVGSGERPTTWLDELLRSRNRHRAGASAPPQGLILMRIGYPPNDSLPGREAVGVEYNEIVPCESAGG